MKKFILLAVAVGSAVFLVSAAGAARHDPPCTISAGSVSLDQSYTVSAQGLPTGGTVNMIVTYPNGTTSTGPVSVAVRRHLHAQSVVDERGADRAERHVRLPVRRQGDVAGGHVQAVVRELLGTGRLRQVLVEGRGAVSAPLLRFSRYLA